MIANIYNENYGYSTACDKYWAAVSNPSLLRYTPESSSILRTGSVEVYKYNINTDTHDKKAVLYRHISDEEVSFLTTEFTNSGITGPDYILHTEYTGTIPLTADKDIILDVGSYFTSSENGYGIEIDINGYYLAVGCPYSSITSSATDTSYYFSGSGQVDVYDLTRLDIDPYANRLLPTISSYTITTVLNVIALVPPNQQYSYILLESRDTSLPSNPWESINLIKVTNSGGYVTIPTGYPNATGKEFRVSGIVGTDPYLITISNPINSTTESFGSSVSINNEWLAIGSSKESGSKGAVFMYRRTTGAEASWSFYQTLPVPSTINTGDNFGRSICLNKATGSYSGSLVVGSAKTGGSKAYVYEFNGSNWNNTFTLNPDNNTIYPLTFYPTYPVLYGPYPNTEDRFGWAVSMFKDTIVVGAPLDRYYYEYSGSSVYQQGSVYFFERCDDVGMGYYLARKSYGDEKILNNNALGTSVGVYNNYAIAGSPKVGMPTICYLRGTLFQQNFCEENAENIINGQFILFQQTNSYVPYTSNKDWKILNTYQTKKKILEPYRNYGFSCDICDSFITIGSPFFISGSYRIMDFSSDTGSFMGNLDNIGDLSGKAYIYNLKNLKENFYVGNIFYRNGKLVVMSSGSNFDGILLVGTDDNYEYNLSFKSKQVIFEKQVVCAVDVGEFNVSTNPTSIILPTSSFDINNNGVFDFQDCDVLLRYMKYKSTEANPTPSTDWSSSVINTSTNEEMSVYNMYYDQWYLGSSALFTSSYSYINNTLYSSLDLNGDNKMDINDMNILWKYFINRLTQKNYETYITPNSTRKFLSQILDYLNSKTMKGIPPAINQNFLDYTRLSQSDPTGSYLAPYVTSVGLYSGTELVAVAKLGSPIKITPDFPINFIVKMDF
jgi:hypothetical protein